MNLERYIENHWEETIAAYRKQMECEAALRDKYLQEDLPMYEDEHGLEREENN